MGQFKLIDEIIKLSNSNTWHKARDEWSLKEIYYKKNKEPDACLCGKYPIIEVCVIENKSNRHTAIVGNSCVKKFLDLSSGKIFQSIKKVRGEIEKALNAETIKHARKKRWINQWQYDFYMDTRRKRKLTTSQNKKRIEVNEKILKKIFYS